MAARTPEAEPLLTPAEVATMLSRPEDGDAVGQGGQADVHPHARRPPPVPGD